MKIKKIILFLLLMLSSIQLTRAQKINLIYTIKTTDSLYVFEGNAFSDKNIQTKAHKIFSKNIPDKKDIISIEDNLNRKFEKTDFNHVTYYSKLLNEGHFNLYELELNYKPVYFIYSKNDTLILENNDSVLDRTIMTDRKYIKKLMILSKDYPDLWGKAGKVNFKKEDLQNFISVLNDKYPGNKMIKHENNRIDYFNLSLKGWIQKNKTDIMLDVLRSHYFLNISPNFSLRYGVRANYFQRTEFFPELFSGLYYSGSDGIRHKVYTYRDHYETMSAKALEIPLSVNFETTNSTITPYFYGGLSPTLYFRKITRTDSDNIDNITVLNLNAFAAAGIKIKLTNSFNILSEYKFDINKGLNLEFGIEYCFRR